MYRNCPAVIVSIQPLADSLSVPTVTPTKNPTMAPTEESMLKMRATYQVIPVERRMT